MSDAWRIAEANRRYHQAGHAIQSAIAHEIALDHLDAAATPKHLRTGVNMAMVDSCALATLLLAKGVFTEAEYIEALADAAEKELQRISAKHPGITFA